MKEFISDLRGAIMSTIVLAIVCCGIYPLVIYALGAALFRDQAEGSLLHDAKGNVVGSRLIGQNFAAPQYFHSRPSDAGNGYDATSSGGSNLGPTSKKLADAIAQSIADYRAENGLSNNVAVPADAVTASASGLDPDISIANADIQAVRVAKARHIDIAELLLIVRKYTDPPSLGFLGEPGVNVLELNLALDAHK